jgi:hypothetical protein
MKTPDKKGLTWQPAVRSRRRVSMVHCFSFYRTRTALVSLSPVQSSTGWSLTVYSSTGRAASRHTPLTTGPPSYLVLLCGHRSFVVREGLMNRIVFKPNSYITEQYYLRKTGFSVKKYWTVFFIVSLFTTVLAYNFRQLIWISMLAHGFCTYYIVL